MSNSKVTSLDIFTIALTLVFVILKLCHVIDWKWIWVLSPLWICLGLSILIVIVIGLFGWR